MSKIEPNLQLPAICKKIFFSNPTLDVQINSVALPLHQTLFVWMLDFIVDVDADQVDLQFSSFRVIIQSSFFIVSNEITENDWR